MAIETETNPPKNVFASKTIWGVIIAALPGILKIFGIDVAPGFSEHAQALIDGGITLFGSLLAFWGRITATKSLVVFKK